MTATNPLDRIEVGKEYRYVPRPAEVLPCEACGYTMAEEVKARLTEALVTVVAVPNENMEHHCLGCGSGSAIEQGHYIVTHQGNRFTAPYPWLLPLEPSGPEPRGG